MEKMKMESANITDMNIEKIAELFPNCITETADENGKLKKAVNFEMLRAMLSEDIAEGDEAYEFTWVGKKAAIAEANRPIRKTLRPCPEESVNWDTTENLYIEGDNLEVLKLLQESYLGKVKMIYIDPPYNTGNDFIYRDDFAVSADYYAEESGQLDEDGNRLFKNTDSNGRFHSDWCSMIYSRLMLARNLLSDDGVIFISIDDNEQTNLKKICDDIFGQDNFVALITVIVKTEGRRYGGFAKTHEQILVYANKNDTVTLNEVEIEGKNFKYSDGVGGFNIQELRNQNARAFNSENRPNLRYPFYVDINNPDDNGFCKVYLEKHDDLEEVYPITVNGYKSVWRWGKNEKASRQLNDLVARKGNDGIIRIYQKMRKLTEMSKTVLMDKEFISIKGTRELQELIGLGVFDFPKPTNLVKYLCKIGSDEDCIILDFFSGSATTAHAVMQLNAEDGGHRKFIMVQLPEKTDESSEAFKAGYKNICEIGKERIRRAGAKIKNTTKEVTIKHTITPDGQTTFGDEDFQIVKTMHEKYKGTTTLDIKTLSPENVDIGFRVLKLDDTNMQDVYYTPAETDQQMLSGFESNIKPDRTDLDLLFGCLLDWGLPLSMPYRSEQIDGVTVHTYNDGDLIACFDKAIPESVIKTIAKRQPLRVVFRDDSFADSPSKINVSEIFKMLSPDTRVKVI